VLSIIGTLEERGARVLRLRYGLEGQAPLTLKQIGAVIGLTRERVRQIEMDTLRRIQHKLKLRQVA
jgi:RNA polymerase primary sigma factor